VLWAGTRVLDNEGCFRDAKMGNLSNKKVPQCYTTDCILCFPKWEAGRPIGCEPLYSAAGGSAAAQFDGQIWHEER
jgi:hypothetical protein